MAEILPIVREIYEEKKTKQTTNGIELSKSDQNKWEKRNLEISGKIGSGYHQAHGNERKY